MAILAAGMLANLASATSDPIVNWTEGFGPGGRAPSAAVLGDHASQVLVVYAGTNGFARLLSVHDASSTPTPIWSTAPAYEWASVQAAAASESSLCYVLARERASSSSALQLVLRCFASDSSAPRWQYTFPLDASVDFGMGLECTPDGSRVAAWTFDVWSYRTKVHVAQGQTGTPVADLSLDTTGAPTGSSHSPEGAACLLTGPHSEVLFDLQTGAVLQQTSVAPTLGSARAVSGLASRVATGRNDGTLQVYQRQAGVLMSWFVQPAPVSGAQFCAAAIAADGSTLAAASYSAAVPGNLRLQILDLGQANHPVVFTQLLPSSASLARITGLGISRDGSRVVATSNGDGSTTLPEVLVFERNNGVWAWSGSMHTTVPVWSASMDPEARRAALLASGAGPAPQYLQLADVRLIDSGDRDLVGRGIPRVGTSFALRQSAPPGSGSRLLVSSALAVPALEFPGIGTLFLPQGQISVAGTGSANGSGWIDYTVALPSGSGAIGSHLEFQGLRRAPRTLTRDFVHVTVLP